MNKKLLKTLCLVLALALMLTFMASCTVHINAPDNNDESEETNNGNDGGGDTGDSNGDIGGSDDGNIDGGETDDTLNGDEEPVDPIEVFSIGVYSNGLARISTSTGYGYINTSGDVVIEPIYSAAEELADELIFVTLDGKQHFIDKSGNIVFTATGNEEKIGPYSNGYFCVVTKRLTIDGNIYALCYYDVNGDVSFELKNRIIATT